MPSQPQLRDDGGDRRHGQSSLNRWAIAIGIAVVMGCGGSILLFNKAMEIAEASPRGSAANNVKHLLLALHNYHDTYRCFPPAVVSDEQGKPLFSGRVLLLPFLERDDLYSKFDQSQTWDSPTNSAVSKTIIRTFNDPRSRRPRSPRTDLLFVTGPETIFESGKCLDFDSVTDEKSATICVLFVPTSDIQWAEPRDLDIRSVHQFPPSGRTNVALVGFVDGTPCSIPCDTPAATVHALLTRSGGESIPTSRREGL